MAIKADDISKIIREQIKDFDAGLVVSENGTVISTGDGIARVHGLEKAMANELLEFPHEVFGLAFNLEEDNVGAILFGEFYLVKEGDIVKRTRRIMQVPVGEAMLGRVVDALGRPIDGKGPIYDRAVQPGREDRARHRRQAAGSRAAADGNQGDRLDGSDRTRAARVDHRRPPDREERNRPRYHHQSEGHRRSLHLRRHRPETVDDRPSRENADRFRGDGQVHRGRGCIVGPRHHAVPGSLLGMLHGRVLPGSRAACAGHL